MVVQVHPKDHQLNSPTSGLIEPAGIEPSVGTSRPLSDNLPVTRNEDQLFQGQSNEDQLFQGQTYHRDLKNQDWPLKYTTVDTSDREPVTELKPETDDGERKPETDDGEKKQKVDGERKQKVDGRKLDLEGRFSLHTQSRVTMIDRHNIHRVFGHKIWFVTDVCGIICASFTYWLLLFAQYTVLTCILLPEESLLYKGMYLHFWLVTD